MEREFHNFRFNDTMDTLIGYDEYDNVRLKLSVTGFDKEANEVLLKLDLGFTAIVVRLHSEYFFMREEKRQEDLYTITFVNDIGEVKEK